MWNFHRVRVLLALFVLFSFVTLDMAQIGTANDPMETAGKFEGDMVFNKEQQQVVLDAAKCIKPVIPDNTRYLWPSKTVLYRIGDEFAAEDYRKIRVAIQKICSASCVKFQVAPASAKAYVKIQGLDTGCFSEVGYQGGKVQVLNLQRGTSCLDEGKIVHELLHTVGFVHQQSDLDRDNYVRIFLDNIQPDKLGNFAKYPMGNNYGFGYDHGSLMHFGNRAFSRNNQITIDSRLGIADIGQRKGMSQADIQKLRKMYKC